MARREFWSDVDTLKVLHLSEVEQLPASVIGKRYGVTKSAILGLMNRVRTDLRLTEHGPEVAVRPENRDGGMPLRWWDIPGRVET